MNITKDQLINILQTYYPKISHKTADRIIRDIENCSEKNEKTQTNWEKNKNDK